MSFRNEPVASLTQYGQHNLHNTTESIVRINEIHVIIHMLLRTNLNSDETNCCDTIDRYAISRAVLLCYDFSDQKHNSSNYIIIVRTVSISE